MSIPTPVLHPSAVASDGTNIWVTLEDVGKVRKLDRITGAAIGDFATGLAPLALAFDGTSMVVANASSATVSAIDPNGVAPGHPIDRRVGAGPSAVVYDGTNIWVANYDDGTVSKLTP
jgi:DNA-binding beta-propeller fold protein YncE